MTLVLIAKSISVVLHGHHGRILWVDDISGVEGVAFCAGGTVHSRYLSYAAVLAAGFLTACAATPNDFLSADTRAKIASTEVVVPVSQNEIYIYVPPSTSGAVAGAAGGLVGGLVGAIIDASINSVQTHKAETAVKPLRDVMVDYNFDPMMQGDVRDALAPLSWLGIDKIRVSKQVDPKGLDAELAKSTDGAILVVSTQYSLSNDARALTVTVSAGLYPNNDALRAIKRQNARAGRVAVVNSLYHNTLKYEAKLSNATPDRDKNVALWSANQGAATRAALTAGAKEVAAMLAADIQRTGADAPAGAESATVDGQAGFVVAKQADGEMVRFKDGSLIFAANDIQ